MNVVPFSKQWQLIRHILDRETTVIVYGGGIRGGKTFGVLVGLFLYFRKYRRSRAAIVRDSIPTLFRNTVPSYNKITNAKLIESQNQMQSPVRVRDSELIFFGENYGQDKELNRWKGLEVNVFVLEEFNELQEESFNKAIERAGSWIVPDVEGKDQPPPKIICTCNPSRGWVKDRIYDKHLAGTLPKGWVYIPALINENPYIPEAYKENLKNLPPREYNTFVKGDWDSLTLDNLFIETFDESRNIRTVEYDRRLDVYLCWDFNIENTCLVVQLEGSEIRVLREYHLKGGLEKICALVASDYPDAYFIINGDASGSNRNPMTDDNQTGYQLMRNTLDLGWKQFRVPAANPSHEASYKISNLVFRHRKVLIHPSCTGLRKDLLNVQIIRRGKKLEIDKSDPMLTHHLDPLRYHIFAEHVQIVKELNLEDVSYYQNIADWEEVPA